VAGTASHVRRQGTHAWACRDSKRRENIVLGLLKKLFPPTARTALRSKLADWKLHRAIQPLIETGRFTDAQLLAFRRAWSNEGFSADVRYLAETIRLIEKHGGPVLECGTGATSLIAGILGERYGFETYCLEQDPVWSLIARRALEYHRIGHVHILDTPLQSYGPYVWYDTAGQQLPKHFGVILCDGPFVDRSRGDAIYNSWRYGVLPFLHRTDATFDALLLDDVNDKRAMKVLQRWIVDWNTRHDVISSDDGDCAIVRAGYMN
jgi:hypothetical protein